VRKKLVVLAAVAAVFAAGGAIAKGNQKGGDQGGDITPFYGVGGGPVDPSKCSFICFGVARSRVMVSPTFLW